MSQIYLNIIQRNESIVKKYIIIISCVLGIVFIFSGVSKLFVIPDFENEIAQYFDYYLNIPFFIEYRKVLSISLCIFEIIVGMMSIIKPRNISIMIITTLLLFVFVYMTGINYFFPAFGRGITSCGCFGEILNISPGWSLTKSVILLILSLFKCLCCYIQMHHC